MPIVYKGVYLGWIFGYSADTTINVKRKAPRIAGDTQKSRVNTRL